MVPPAVGVAAPSGGAPVEPAGRQGTGSGRILLIVAVVLAAVALPLVIAAGYALLNPPYDPRYNPPYNPPYDQSSDQSNDQSSEQSSEQSYEQSYDQSNESSYEQSNQSSQTDQRVPEDARHYSAQDQEVILGAMRIADAVGSCYSDHWYVDYEDDPTAEDDWISSYGLAADYLDGPWPVNPYTGAPMREVAYDQEKAPGDFANEAPWTEKSSGLIVGYIVVTLSTGETYSIVYQF